MALPTVSYHRFAAGTDLTTLEAVMTQLHTMLIAAGWSVEWADSTAIGTGTALDPAWDQTPVANNDTAGGNAVYQMPANGHTTEWYVKITCGWRSTNQPFIDEISVGTTHDGSGTVAGVAVTVNSGTGTSSGATNDDNPCMLSVSEDGFCVVWDGLTNSPWVLTERIRAYDGTVGDDVGVIVRRPVTTTNIGAGRVSAADGPTNENPVVLGAWQTTEASLTVTPSLLVGSDSMIVGPRWAGYDMLSAPPRHVVFLNPTDTALGADVVVSVDSATPNYRVVDTANTSLYYAAVAKA